MRRAGDGNDPLGRSRTRLVDRDARSRIAANLTDPRPALADNRSGQLIQTSNIKQSMRITPRGTEQNSRLSEWKLEWFLGGRDPPRGRVVHRGTS